MIDIELVIDDQAGDLALDTRTQIVQIAREALSNPRATPTRRGAVFAGDTGRPFPSQLPLARRPESRWGVSEVDHRVHLPLAACMPDSASRGPAALTRRRVPASDDSGITETAK
jgi:hypothetical protein